MRETRTWRVPALELRAADNGEPILDGYGAVFNRYSRNLGGFVEQIDPVAFNDTLSRNGNVAGLGNHNPDWLLSSTESGTLTLSADSTGLRYAMHLDAGDPDAQRMMAKVKTGKIKGSSFSFRTLADDWSTTDQGFPLRTLRSVELFDVGPVTFPAYESTSEDGLAVALRSLATQVDRPLEELVAAAGRNELRSYLPGGALPPVIVIPNDDVDPAQHASPLSLRRRRLDLELRRQFAAS